MRIFYVTFSILVTSISVSLVQNDTLLWENFEGDTLDYIENDFPSGESNLHPTWLNFDVDGISGGSGTSPDRAGEWFLSFGFAFQDSTNIVLASNSWLQNEADGADNWLISPRVHIQDNQATLYWKSAPFQTPRYLDGYQVLVSTTTNDETSFTDTLAQFAEFNGDLTTDIEDTATYVFTAGIMHTEIEADSADYTRNRGVLQQWEASLADYSGMDIHVAFRHRSDNDNLISIDDILILGTGSVGIADVAQLEGISIYPNPTEGIIKIEIENRNTYAIEVMNMLGELVHSSTTTLTTHLDLSEFGSGFYMVRVSTDANIHTEKIIVQ